MKKITDKFGSNPGGVYQDEKGENFYVKFYDKTGQMGAEVMCARVYEAMGIATTQPEIKLVDDRIAIVTPWNCNLKRIAAQDFLKLSDSNKKQLARIFYAAVLTKNWDIIGLEYDNVMLDSATENLVVVDCGGAFEYRARGAYKHYGPDICEVISLRNPEHAAGRVFNELFSEKGGVMYAMIENLLFDLLKPTVVKTLFKSATNRGKIFSKRLAMLRALSPSEE